jgi:formate dehydrogenase iron-sulfur subunit
LGRPFYAFRAILGLRHSWLSREIVAFGLFAALASAYAVAIYYTSGNPNTTYAPDSTSALPWLQWLGISVASSGAVAVFCSIMIYVFTQRECWSFIRVSVRFVLTSALLGMAVVWFSILGLTLVHPTTELTELIQRHGTSLCMATIAFAGAKLLWDATIFRHLLFRRMTSLKRSAMLMTHELSNFTLARFAAGILGGIVLPMLLLISLNSIESSNLPKFVILTGMQFVACLVGEILERALFFTACAAPKMPGAIR